MKVFKSCVDQRDNKFFFPQVLVKNEIVIVYYEEQLKVKEIVNNVLHEKYGKKRVLNFNLNFKEMNSDHSIFKMKKLEKDFLFYKLQRELNDNDVIVFDNIESQLQVV